MDARENRSKLAPEYLTIPCVLFNKRCKVNTMIFFKISAFGLTVQCDFAAMCIIKVCYNLLPVEWENYCKPDSFYVDEV